MSPIALPGRRASIPSQGIAPRASWRNVILTIAPIALARSAIEAIQSLPAPLRLIPTTFGGTVLLFLTRPLFLCFFSHRQSFAIPIARQRPHRLRREQGVLANVPPARSKYSSHVRRRILEIAITKDFS